MTEITEKSRFSIIESMVKKVGLVDHQITSFNRLINSGLQEVIAEEPTIEVTDASGKTLLVEFGQVHVDKPTTTEEDRSIRKTTPGDCRNRGETYDGTLSVTIKTTSYVNGVKKAEKTYDKHVIGRIPIMVGSDKCQLNKMSSRERIENGEDLNDPGGYFIIKGNERTLITQERANLNTIFCFEQKKQSKNSHTAECRSMSPTTGHSVLIQASVDKSGKNIHFSLPYIQHTIPVGVVFVAMGYNPEDIITLVDPQHPKVQSMCELAIRECYATNLVTKNAALDEIGRHAMHVVQPDKRRAYASQILENEMLPHFGVISSTEERGRFLGAILYKLFMTHQGLRPDDDRDNLTNKRFEVAGVLVGILFRSLYKRLVRSLVPVLQKRQDILIALSRFNLVTQGFRSCFGTGKWGVQKNSYVRQGVSQVLVRLAHQATLSHLRRIVIPVGKEGKNTKIRQLHGSQIGFICLWETPEGHASGINKNFCIGCIVSNGTSVVLVHEFVTQVNIVKSLEDEIESGATRVYINGKMIGMTTEPLKLCNVLREHRKNRKISTEVSIAFDDIDKEIHIATDSGRLLRPLIQLIDGKVPDFTMSDWNTLVKQGIVVFRDPAELENMVIAMDEKSLHNSEHTYDLMEIHPSLMMGVCASHIPFPDHSQSPRNTYQSAMGKQALGIYSHAHNARSDTIVYLLHHAQKPLTTTKASTLMGMDELPSGQNAMVAIATYTGFNQEDSIMMSQSAIERGLFAVTSYRCVSHLERKRGTSCQECIVIPPLDARKRFYNYSSLGKNGVIQVNSVIKKGDVLIGRVLKIREKSTGKIKITDCSITARAADEGVVDSVIFGTTPESFKFVKIKIRLARKPQVGDKLASRSAQKGTVGAVYKQEDMPFMEDGTTPDLIINPHCLIGNTIVTHQDGTVNYIKDIYNKDTEVATIDPKTLKKTSTRYHSGFKKNCDKVLEVETLSGRKAGCTPEHLWLTLRGKEKMWVKTEDLIPWSDRIFVKHSILPVPGDNGQLPFVFHTGYEKYNRRLQELGLLGKLNKRQSLILARLLGLVESDGHISDIKTTGSIHKTLFYVGENSDFEDISRDLSELGFEQPTMREQTNNQTKIVTVEPSVGSLLITLGACCGNKTTSERTFPKWILDAPSDVKREFLSGYNGGDGSKLGINVKTNQQQIRHRGIRMRATIETQESHKNYLENLNKLFGEFDIKCTIRSYLPKEENKVDLMLCVSLAKENLEKFVDYIGWRYCAHKTRESALHIEILKTRIAISKTAKDPKWGKVMCHQHFSEWFTEDLAVPVVSVKEIQTEPVYDFTTVSENHSFIANGLVSHNCIPSRMTINQLIEALVNGLVVYTGVRHDSTPFTNSSTDIVPKIRETLSEIGMNPNGTRKLYNGFTGQEIKADIYMGLTMYQRLKHMVKDKVHARAHGDLQVLTRQPLEGRSREGGMRSGEMERDCLLGHGAVQFLQEKLLKLSDYFEVDVCKSCHKISNADCCTFCGGDDIVPVKIPYACKLLFHELMAMGLRIDILPD